jgi:tetratricopeptide (TPR) repeat protein
MESIVSMTVFSFLSLALLSVPTAQPLAPSPSDPVLEIDELDFNTLTAQDRIARATRLLMVSSLSPSQTVDTLMRRGDAYMHLRNYKAAYADYTEALSRDAAHVEAKCGTCRALAALGDIDAARVSLEEITSKELTNVIARITLAKIYFAKGDRSKALSTINEALQLDSTNCEARFLRANMFYSAFDYEESLRDLDNIIVRTIMPAWRAGDVFALKGFVLVLKQAKPMGFFASRRGFRVSAAPPAPRG